MTISDVAAPAAPVSDVAATRRRPGADRARDAAPRLQVRPSRHYAMTAPTFFTVEYAINPWMDTSTPVDTHRRAQPMGGPAPDLQGTRPHRRTGRARRRPAGHGVRRQRRTDRQRQGRRRPVRLPAARRRVRRLRRVDGPPRLPSRRHPARQRGPGRPARRRLNHLGGLWFPHRTAGPRRDRRRARRCRSSASSWSTRASIISTPRWRCSTTPRSPTTRPHSVTQSRAQLLELFPDAIEVASADAYVLGLNAVSDGLNVVLPAAATGFAEQLRRGRIPADRCRSVRTAQGRRIRQMLHVGGTSVTILTP